MTSAAVGYELWDAETGNLIGWYPDESAALASVREDVRRLGSASHATVALLRRDEGAAVVTRVAHGEALIRKAGEG